MKVTLKLGVTIQEETRLSWGAKPGGEFANDEVLFEIDIGKGTQVIMAPISGRVSRRRG